jgi:hypothetical protein
MDNPLRIKLKVVISVNMSRETLVALYLIRQVEYIAICYIR